MTIQFIHELGPLFEAVQQARILGDGKTFPDCVPLRNLDGIAADYGSEHQRPNFDLAAFVRSNFTLPVTPEVKAPAGLTAEFHVKGLWPVLTRQSPKENSSIIDLPHPYVVPGGRFREIYYWDSYFTMLGLRLSGLNTMVTNMVDNFCSLIDRFGYIPNGNRSYFLGRSQPPFFSHMVTLLEEEAGDSILLKYLPQLQREHDFWMRGEQELSPGTAIHRVVKLPDGAVLNRYWDEHATPRPESWLEDVDLAAHADNPTPLYRHLRAAAESGWDFSSRWFKTSTFESIHTTDIIPVDLNCLLYHLEQVLAKGYGRAGKPEQQEQYSTRAGMRAQAIRQYCWQDSTRFFGDYDFVAGRPTSAITLAGLFPLYEGLATAEQSARVAERIKEHFLKAGGLTTTLVHSGQQWDAPNGWAPLQWIATEGLRRSGHQQLADEICRRWIHTAEEVFRATGKMTEKYDVWQQSAAASGGEYPNQDGFGWTNGVYLAMIDRLPTAAGQAG